MTIGGKTTLSLNGFMYRERGILIAYLLCGVCALELFKTSRQNQMLMYEKIENNLVRAYKEYLASLNA